MKEHITMNARGVITLPAKLRRALGLEAGEVLVAETTPDGILLRPTVSIPVEIYTEERIEEFASDAPAIERLLRERD